MTDSQQSSQPTTPEGLLDAVKNASPNQRLGCLQDLARALKDSDQIIINYFADQLKAANVCNKKVFVSTVHHYQADTPGEIPLQKICPTDDDLAKQWISQNPHTAYGLGEFRRYDDGIWKPVPLDDIKKEILNVVTAAKPNGIRPTQSLCDSVREMARTLISVPAEKWDSNVDLIPCKNGVYDLTTLKLLPHTPENYLTSKLDYDYDPLASCPNYLHALQTTIPDAINLLQEYAGLSLTTDTRYETALFLYGPPASGKSTAILGIQTMLGKQRASVLGLGDIKKSRFALSNLVGKTLLMSSEQPTKWADVLYILNAIISGEPILIERKFQQPFEYSPYAKFIWAMNELPKIDKSENGIFRRLFIIPFLQVPKEKRDPDLKAAIMTEGPGILNWGIEGLIRLRKQGKFSIPNVVVEATKQYINENDPVAIFIAEKCITDPQSQTQSSVLHDAYSSWCFENKYQAKSVKKIAADWERFGFEKRSSNGREYWHGIRLQTSASSHNTSEMQGY
ncbi:MAG: phage/plasmid primase, P4 family [Chloroflexi bacterium]|nr:phage/plasmid primase, P4 family [Chloroflexota bacterium]